ncbi:helix-turn-helix domain-containing protein [Nonomuraea sp. NPDC003201]
MSGIGSQPQGHRDRRHADVHGDDPVALFAQRLRQLHEQCGSPSVRELARLARQAQMPCSKSAIAAAMQGYRLPTPAVLRALVQALGQDPRPWLEEREQALARYKSSRPATPTGQHDPAVDGADQPEAVPPDGSEDTAAVPSRRSGSVGAFRPRLRTTGLAAIVVLVVAGAFWLGHQRSGHTPTGAPALTSQATSGPSHPPQASTATGVSTDAVTEGPYGPGCPADRFYADPGWLPVSGGWRGNGCDGTALAMQVAGTPGHFTQQVNWYFDSRPGARCTIEVFIADDPASAGTAFYYLDDDNTDPPHLAGPLPVDQRTHHGTWARLGTFAVPRPGRLTVILGNQPRTDADTYTVTASSARGTCR